MIIEGRTQKTTVATGFTGVVFNVKPKFFGPPKTVTYSLVAGKQSYNNADFSIDANTGALTLNNAFGAANKTKFARVRMETADGQVVEKAIKVRSVTNQNPAVTGSLTYHDTTVAGEVIATITSTFNDATFAIRGKLATTGTPGTAETAENAFDVVQTSPTTAEVRWSGREDPTQGFDFSLIAINRDTEGCIYGETGFDVPYDEPCSNPVSFVSQFRGTARGNGSYSASFTAARSNLESDVYQSTSTSANTAGLQPYAGNSIFDLYRGYVEIDVTSLDIISITVREGSRKTLNTNADYSVRVTQVAPGSSAAGIDSWTEIYSDTVIGTDSPTMVDTDKVFNYDVSGLTGSLYIGNIFESDRLNSPITYGSTLVSDTAHIVRIVSIGGCP